MKYAVPVNDGKLSPHFGQSSAFMLIDTDGKNRIIGKEILSTPAHDCGTLPRLLAEHGTKNSAGRRYGIRTAYGFSAKRHRCSFRHHRIRSRESSSGPS